MQYEPLLRLTWRKLSKSPETVPYHLPDQPHHDEHCRYTAFRRVLNVDVVQVPVISGWQRAGNVGRYVVLKLLAYLFRS
jgi:hypothetical protein